MDTNADDFFFLILVLSGYQYDSLNTNVADNNTILCMVYFYILIAGGANCHYFGY